MEEKRIKGVIRNYNFKAAYGFIEAGLNKEVFFHVTDFSPKVYPIVHGTEVEFRLEESSKGFNAKEIKVLKLPNQFVGIKGETIQ